MKYTMSEVLQFVEENDVKFVRLAFCDIFGNQKNISVMPGELPRAFDSGISFDASAIPGFMNVEQSDLFLVPDASTLSILPWRPSHGRVVRFFCDIRYPDASPFEGDARGILKNAVEAAMQLGLVCKIGSECEFYLFKTDEDGNPTKDPHDQAGYFDIAPRDCGENVRREICLTLEQMGIIPESSHHEQGPGQNEIDFKYSDALTAADHLITFKSVVKTIAAQNGLYASFMPKPFKHQSGNGLHVNLSLFKNGLNIFRTDRGSHSPVAESFIAGVLARVPEMTAFLNPLTNSYVRFGSFEAPKYVTWSHQNRSQLIRIPAATGVCSRMELRSPDPACNPYLAFALLIYAGLDGMKRELQLPEPSDFNVYEADEKQLENLTRLPANLGEAIGLAQNSAFLSDVLPSKIIEHYCSAKFSEQEELSHAKNEEKFEQKSYFFNI
ncbi:glutamine synthetase family protein [Candidatus Soleaferrea massiliensis]|uniref:glutamine synthetase family protein n=1 Tax=Candidatus Soleaferrea massiliensis TaxID=1470354 RepID=UPI000590B004|nr:glutamine synthetase family protein [Candidatus Soleaferrea massiliensis]